MDGVNRPNVKVLVIDDSETARAAMADTLIEAGYRVLELPSAIGATRMILRNDVQVVIVDVTMPGLSGDMLVRVLRSNSRLKELVIVVVSGMATESLERIRAEVGADAVLAKTAIETDLALVVMRLLAMSPAERAEANR
ncbi:MAG TPA: response regulator [Polyangiales bacterium]|nr:response regulator [Polyangiales bacterium]